MMLKRVDSRPFITLVLGGALVLLCSAVLVLRVAEASSALFFAVKARHAEAGRVFLADVYWTRCAVTPKCVAAYGASSWRAMSDFERSCCVGLVLGLGLVVVGKVWNPSLLSSNRTQSKGLLQNALPARSSARPGWFS